MTTIASPVAMMSAQVPALIPAAALTINIATRGPNSLRILTVCFALKGKKLLRSLILKTDPFSRVAPALLHTEHSTPAL